MVVNNKYTPGIKKFAKIYAIAIPLGFAIIAIYHHFNPITH
jgi:succinate dehydrogenase / fumarate reductase cytochrome b subunit